ncbi:ataxin-7-like protein 1 [Octopus bimaculoides]|uniref:ataxin-7-like protein 1 n=1 Tax=Octopus bimaculoides TaxID=37653 RepID=UPI0022E33F8D|nr:ataxin-7-like protein 1 [Octopus bimaculoides]
MQQETCKMATVGDSPAKYAGQPWTVWAENVPLKDDVGCTDTKSGDIAKDDNDCMKLRKEDMPLYGLCPTKDELYLVVCDTCHLVIKPQAFSRHCAIRHGEKYPKSCVRLYQSSKFRSKASVKQLPSSLLSTVSPPYNSKVNATASKEKNHAMPVVKVERMPEKLPVKKPFLNNTNSNSTPNNVNNNTNSSNVSANTNANTNFATSSSSDSVASTPNQCSVKPAITNGTLKDAAPILPPVAAQAGASSTTTTSRDCSAALPLPNAMAYQNCCNKIVCQKPQKKEKLLPCKDREFDANKHCGVKIANDSKPCTRSLTCKTHALSLRRAVVGRRKPFDELLKDHRAAKEAIQREKVHAQYVAAAQRVAAQTAPASGSLAHSGNCSGNSNSTPSTANTIPSNTSASVNASGLQSLIPTRSTSSNSNSTGGVGGGGGGGGGGGSGVVFQGSM